MKRNGRRSTERLSLLKLTLNPQKCYKGLLDCLQRDINQKIWILNPHHPVSLYSYNSFSYFCYYWYFCGNLLIVSLIVFVTFLYQSTFPQKGKFSGMSNLKGLTVNLFHNIGQRMQKKTQEKYKFFDHIIFINTSILSLTSKAPKSNMHHLSVYNYKYNGHFLKDVLDNRWVQNKPTTVWDQSYDFKYTHQRCTQIIFHINFGSHLLLQAIFVLRKLQVYAAQLQRLKDCINTQDGKRKMDTLIKIIGIFAKEKLKQDEREHFLGYRSIQCSKFPILPLDQGPADLARLEEQKRNMERTSTIAIQNLQAVKMAIRANEDIAKIIADSRASLYGPECNKVVLLEKISEFYKASFASIPQLYEAKWEEIYGKTRVYEAYLKSPKNMEIMA